MSADPVALLDGIPLARFNFTDVGDPGAPIGSPSILLGEPTSQRAGATLAIAAIWSTTRLRSSDFGTTETATPFLRPASCLGGLGQPQPNQNALGTIMVPLRDHDRLLKQWLYATAPAAQESTIVERYRRGEFKSEELKIEADNLWEMYLKLVAKVKGEGAHLFYDRGSN